MEEEEPLAGIIISLPERKSTVGASIVIYMVYKCKAYGIVSHLQIRLKK